MSKCILYGDCLGPEAWRAATNYFEGVEEISMQQIQRLEFPFWYMRDMLLWFRANSLATAASTLSNINI